MSTDPSGPGIYIHAPFCKHACPYCDFYKLELRDRPASARLDFPRLIACEYEQILAQAPELATAHPTVYFGGGTPSTLPPKAVGELNELLSAAGDPEEITLEANPENLTEGRAEQWKEAGFNRLSIGVQSFHDHELTLLERLHRSEVIPRAVANARSAGFQNISLDLMFALPGQSFAQWMQNLRNAVELNPEHISFYGLTYHENTPFRQWQEAGDLKEVEEDLQAEMYLRGAEFLESEGFEHYEISNFARPGFRSRHNQRYWQRQDVLGLGPGAHSNIGRRRWQNPGDLDGWAEAIRSGRDFREEIVTLSPEEALGEQLFTALRRAEGVSAQEEAELFALCRGWLEAQDGLADRWAASGRDRIRLTKEGWLVSDGLISRMIGA